jgi:TetR/AcrR family transcriptional repressor of lmrAB and yxaGH operons
MVYLFSMPRKGERTRQKLVQSTAELLARRGYSGTGLNDILQAGDAPRGSLYFHFPGGKAQLASAALDRMRDGLAQELKEAVALARTPVTVFEKVSDLLLEKLRESNLQVGCPIAPTALDVSSQMPELQEACALAYRTWVQVAVDRLRELGVEPQRAEKLAEFALAALEGGLLLSRAYGDPAPLENVRRRLRSVFLG